MNHQIKVLIIKTSSMGDVIHTLPALTDAKWEYPEIRFDWVVEEGFKSIVELHPLVNRVLPVALRRWRKRPLKMFFSREFAAFFRALRAEHYDYVIDAQGLLKSAIWARLARGISCGYDFKSAREPLAAAFYRRRYVVSKAEHAVTRTRSLFAQVLGYPVPDRLPQYGLQQAQFLPANGSERNYIVMLHGTSWNNKQWPEVYWSELVRIVHAEGYCIKLVWGSQEEHLRSNRLAQRLPGVEVTPQLDIAGVAKLLSNAAAVVAVDTGFAHLSEALGVPMISLYGPTSADLTGPLGWQQKAIAADFPCAPCFKRTCHYLGDSEVRPACFGQITPELVWARLQGLMNKFE